MPMSKPSDLKRIAEQSGNEQICYVLGAGFSNESAYKLPVATGFLSREARIYCQDVTNRKGTIAVADHPELPQLLSRLEERYGDLGSLNLESVMSDLFERTAGVGRAWSDRDVATVDRLLLPADPSIQAAADDIPLPPLPQGADLRRDYELLLLYICLRLRIVEVPGAECPAECPMVRRLLHTVRRRDSIITLNYDTIIERHLTYRERGPGDRDKRLENLDLYIGSSGASYSGGGGTMFGRFQPRRGGFLAKLHGSVNWRACSEPACPNHRYIESTDRRRSDNLDGAEQLHCGLCGNTPDTVVIPPVATKPFDRFPKLRLMWLQAYHSLRLANRWVFIGVSLAPTDMHLRSLLRAASEDWIGTEMAPPGQICVVNPDGKVAGRLRECLSPWVQNALSAPDAGIVTFDKISDYLAAVERTDVDRATGSPTADTPTQRHPKVIE